jgi:hypothetical protein
MTMEVHTSVTVKKILHGTNLLRERLTLFGGIPVEPVVEKGLSSVFEDSYGLNKLKTHRA